MKKEVRTVCFDEDLSIEALRFEGVTQPFPNHFHDYYVIGSVQGGRREMFCKSGAVKISGGDVLLLEPGDSHGCVQTDDGVFDYAALNVSADVMRGLAEEITGENGTPGFSENVLKNAELSALIVRLCGLILSGSNGFEKEETLLILMSNILENYGEPFLQAVAPNDVYVERVCEYINARFDKRVTLGELCEVGRMSRSTLLRSFAKFKGITPYRYLQSVRINRARELLTNGTPPIKAASLTGFSDQSHFSNAFHTFFGLSPAAYGKIFGRSEKENKKR